MERERYDGADVIHILHARGAALDWPRLVDRFGDTGACCSLNLVLFGFVYPGEASPAPRWVMDTLLARWTTSSTRRRRDERDLPRHADLARAVPRRHLRMGLRRRAHAAARPHERRRRSRTGPKRSATAEARSAPAPNDAVLSSRDPVGELAARRDAELGEHVGQVRADRAGRDPERGTDLLVRLRAATSCAISRSRPVSAPAPSAITRAGGRARDRGVDRARRGNSVSAPMRANTSCARRSSRVAPSRSPSAASSCARLRRIRAASNTNGTASSWSAAERSSSIARGMSWSRRRATSASLAVAHASPSAWPICAESRRSRSP